MNDGLSHALRQHREQRTAQQNMTQRQEMLAEAGLAVNQCPHCGSYRADERPPILHEVGCPSYGVIPAWSLPGPGAA